MNDYVKYAKYDFCMIAQCSKLLKMTVLFVFPSNKGTTINDLGAGPEEIEKKKKFGDLSPGKNKFLEALSRKKKILRGLAEEKINFERPRRGKKKF